MEIAILGRPQSGKSSIFEIMTGIKSREVFGEQFVRGVAKVPDLRFEKLVETFKPAKITPASIPFVDVNAAEKDAWNATRQSLGSCDAILHVVDAFNSQSPAEAAKSFRALEDELIISDLGIVEKRLERLVKIPKAALKADEAIHAKVLPPIKEHLESGKPIRELDIPKDEAASLKSFSFWSQKPQLVVLNTSEGAEDFSKDFSSTAGFTGEVLSICCKVEAEIAELPPEERSSFLKSLGIDRPAFESVVQASFKLLSRIYYFTVGEDEVRAWIIRAGSTAPQAAGAIHKDFERGFIKAEVVSYEDFIASGSSIASAKSAGKLRLEGKEYIVKDGDIINFRFNV